MDVAEELLDGLVQHRPTPDHGLLVVDEEADGHQRDTVCVDGQHHTFQCDRRAADAEHLQDGVAPHVRVEHADAPAFLGEGCRKVDGDRRLADAALSTGHGVDLRGGSEAEPVGAAGVGALQLACEIQPVAFAHGSERHLDLRGPPDLRQRRGHVLNEVVLQRAGRGGQPHGHANRSARSDVHRLEHPGIGQRHVQLGILNLGQRVADEVLVYRGS